MTQKAQFTLASASPRRADLLRAMGLQFAIAPADIDESQMSEEAPLDYVKRMSQSKAKQLAGDLPVLAADTVVVLGESVFGKPKNEQDAVSMWQRLSARSHQVMTSVSLFFDGQLETQVSSSDVVFRDISDAEMRRYWQSGEPHDKAGGYAIQGLASAWVLQISGSYSGVVGLPMYETNELLKHIGCHWM